MVSDLPLGNVTTTKHPCGGKTGVGEIASRDISKKVMEIVPSQNHGAQTLAQTMGKKKRAKVLKRQT